MSANSRHQKSGGGSSQDSTKSRPKYTSISPASGQAYLTAARRYCLESLSEVVTIFCRGNLPLEMLEIPLPYDKRNMIGRKSGKYHNADGKLATADQLASAWRVQLIADTRAANAGCSEKAALELLFPLSGKKAREAKRQLLATQSLQLMNLLNLFWPSDAMVLEMEKNKGLRDATNCQDIIAWENAFTKFCLDNCGNADMNVRAAEDALDLTAMKDMDLSNYIKSFRIAYNNVRQCQSTYTEKRVVEVFIRNLNQSSAAFHGFSRRILDSNDTLYKLVSQPLEAAITYVENFHKTVIIPELAAAKRQSSQSSMVIKSDKELKQLMNSHSASGANQGPLLVPYPILAAMVRNSNNNNNNDNKNNNSNKRKVEAATKEEARKKAATTAAKAAAAAAATAAAASTTTGSIKAEDKAEGKANTKRTCYNFARTGNCDHGDKCHFSHKA